jgi:phage baseplate assembly protein gpV/phage protein D
MRRLTGLPRVSLRLAGRALAPPEADALASVRVRQALSVPAQCELAFVEPPASLLADAAPGAALEVGIGAAGPLFAGDVTAVESSWAGRRLREVRVRGYDALHRLRKLASVRAHAQITAAGLARELASELGVEVEALADSPPWPWLLQWKQSALDLLAEVAARSGLYLVLTRGTLRLLGLAGAGDPIPLVAGEGLLDCDVEVNADRACAAVEAAGWDLVAVEARRARADDLPAGRPNAAAAVEDGAFTLADIPSPSAAHLEAAAHAELLRRAASEAVLRGATEGDPRLAPGARVALSGVAAPLCGVYVLTEVDHVLDARRGFVSHVTSSPPERPSREDGAGAALAEVTAVEEVRGRVRARLSGHGDVETDWLPVASPGAGASKGLVALPDVGDRVLILFHRADPARGVVVGGLWSPPGPPGEVVANGRVRRLTLCTAGGRQLELDDAARSLRLADGMGSFVELRPDGVTLHAAAPLTIEAPGKPVVVRAASVDFRRA